jgi:hypothetical protein
MPANLDYQLYFNIAFFALIGFGFLVGLIQGLRKSLYTFIVTAIFYGLFFISVDTVASQLWVTPLPYLFSQLGGVVPGIQEASTFGDALQIIIQTYLGSTLGDATTNPELLAFVSGIGMLVLKLVYALLYFSIFQILYRFIFFIFRLIFVGKTEKEINYKLARKQIRVMKLSNRKLRKIKKTEKKSFKRLSRKERKMLIKEDRKMQSRRKRNKAFKRLKKETKQIYKNMSRKEKRNLSKEEKRKYKFILKRGYYFTDHQLTQFMNKPSKNPLLGGVFGALKGAMAAFVSLILIGGLINIMDSFMAVLPTDDASVSREYVEQIFLSNSPVDDGIEYVPLASSSPFDVPPELQNQLDLVHSIVDAFNNNIFVVNASKITYGDVNYETVIPLHLYLFDQVLSFDYQDNKIMIRQELDTLSNTASILLQSDYATSNNLSDITQDEIIELFDTMSNSKLVTSLLPLAIEVGSDSMDVPLEIPVDDLYNIDWSDELKTLGSVAAVGFDLVNTAGLLSDNTDLTTVTLDGSEVKSLFDSLAESDLATMGAYIAVEPLLEQAGGDIQAIITVPGDIVWADEFRAFGLVAQSVLDTGITMDQLSSDDPMNLISTLADVDFTVLLNSEIVSQAMINIFSGEAGISGLDMIIVPDGVQWRDLTVDGNITHGELYNILNAINALTDVSSDFDFNNLNISLIADFDTNTIDTIFESDVLVATISNFVTNDLDFGDTPIVIPDDAFDSQGYLTNVEMKAIANSANVLVTELPCDDGDTACADVGFDFNAAFTLSPESIDTLIDSKIIGATVGNLIIDSAGDALTIPDSALTELSVDNAPVFVVSPNEISSLFQAVSVLDFTDLDTVEFDVGILNRLALDNDPTTLDDSKSDTLFASKIIHATISDMLIDLQNTDDILVVPYFNEDGSVEIRQYDSEDDIYYINTVELEDVLQALISLNIQDFNTIDTLDINDIINHSAEILSSSILQATISKQVLDLGSDIVTVPYVDQDGNDVRVTVGDTATNTQTEYIKNDEINAILDALVVLDVSDIQNFSGDVDISLITSDPQNITTLLNSATIHATISQQMLNLSEPSTPGGEAALSVPYYKPDGLNRVRLTVGPVGDETEYIDKSEIESMIDVLNLLDISSNLEEFDGSVNLGNVLGDPANYDTLLASATIHATISKQLFDLGESGTLEVPYFKEDNLTLVRQSVGNVASGTNTEYIASSEIKALLDVLDLLGIADNLDNFDGSVDLSAVLGNSANYDTLLASATIHATISKQLFDLGESGNLVVPYFDESGSQVRVTVGNVGEQTEYVESSEIRSLLDVLDLLGIADDLANFSGDIDMGSVLGDTNNYDKLLASATIHATISDQLFNLDTSGTLVVPFLEDDDTTLVRVSVGNVVNQTNTDYVSETEIRALLDALNVLGLTDNLEQFDGQVDIASATQVPGNTAKLLSSSIIQATISKQLINLDAGGNVQLPTLREDNSTLVRLHVGDSGNGTDTEYVSTAELEAIIDAMNVLNITGDIAGFDSSNVNLSILGQGNNADTVMSSAMIQATVSKQVIDLVSDPSLTDTFKVPYLEDDGITEIRFNVGDSGAGTLTEYIKKSELVNLVKGMDLLGITDVTTFTGNINLDTFFDPTNRSILLSSSIMQATISAQLIEIDDNTLAIPYVDIDSNPVRIMVDPSGPKEFEYVSVNEIDSIFGAFKELGITNLDNFTGTIDISVLDSTEKQDAVLASASIHAKISDLLTSLDPAVLIVPMYSQVGETNGNEIRLTIGAPGYTTEFVVKNEIKALMNAFTAMGFSDLNSFGSEISSTSFFTSRSTLLLSSSIQATISDKMINDTGGELVVPDQDVRGIPFDIRLNHTDGVTYIEINELNAIFDGLEALGLEDFSTMAFDPATIFSADFDLVLNSASLQATISNNILPNAVDENVVTYNSGTLVVPTALRQSISVNTVANEQIEKNELKQLLVAMNALGFTNDFGSGIGGGAITTMNDATLDEMFDSGSIHTTIDFMLKDNSGLIVPSQAEVDLSFLNGITSETEIRKFLTALNTLGQTDFSSASIGLSALASIDSLSDRQTIADSMITRATLHDDVESLATNPAAYPPGVTSADYMDNDTNAFFIFSTFMDVVETVYPSTQP